MKITQCKVNHLVNPLGYQMGKPVFSWIVENAKSKKQSAARLRVWQDEGKNTCLYDSGWGNLNSLAAEAELPLKPHTRYFWTVTVRGDAGEETESALNWFETGKMDEPWQGKWITCDKDEPRLPVFGRSFDLPGKEIVSARLYICGLGLYRAEINGQPVSDERLSPYCNNYTDWVQYQTYDVTALLSPQNEIAVTLGNGWYKGRFGFSSRGRRTPPS